MTDVRPGWIHIAKQPDRPKAPPPPKGPGDLAVLTWLLVLPLAVLYILFLASLNVGPGAGEDPGVRSLFASLSPAPEPLEQLRYLVALTAPVTLIGLAALAWGSGLCSGVARNRTKAGYLVLGVQGAILAFFVYSWKIQQGIYQYFKPWQVVVAIAGAGGTTWALHINNIDFGLAALGAAWVAVALAQLGQRPFDRRSSLRTLAFGAAGTVAAFLAFTAVTLVRSGQLPRLDLFTYFARQNTLSGSFMLPRPGAFGLHTIMFLTFAGALVYPGIMAISGGVDDRRVGTGLLAFCTPWDIAWPGVWECKIISPMTRLATWQPTNNST